MRVRDRDALTRVMFVLDIVALATFAGFVSCVLADGWEPPPMLVHTTSIGVSWLIGRVGMRALGWC